MIQSERTHHSDWHVIACPAGRSRRAPRVSCTRCRATTPRAWPPTCRCARNPVTLEPPMALLPSTDDPHLVPSDMHGSAVPSNQPGSAGVSTTQHQINVQDLWSSRPDSMAAGRQHTVPRSAKVHLQGTDTPFVCQQLFAEGGRRRRGALPWPGLQSVL